MKLSRKRPSHYWWVASSDLLKLEHAGKLDIKGSAIGWLLNPQTNQPVVRASPFLFRNHQNVFEIFSNLNDARMNMVWRNKYIPSADNYSTCRRMWPNPTLAAVSTETDLLATQYNSASAAPQPVHSSRKTRKKTEIIIGLTRYTDTGFDMCVTNDFPHLRRDW